MQTNLKDIIPQYDSSSYSYKFYLLTQFRDPTKKNQSLNSLNNRDITKKPIELKVVNLQYDEGFQTEKLLSLTIAKSCLFLYKARNGRNVNYKILQNDNILIVPVSKKDYSININSIFSGFVYAYPEENTASGFIVINVKSVESIGLMSSVRGNRKFNKLVGQNVRDFRQLIPALFQSIHLSDNVNVEYINNNSDAIGKNFNLSTRGRQNGANLMHDALRAEQLFMFSDFGNDENTKQTLLSFFTGKESEIAQKKPLYRIDSKRGTVASLIKSARVAEQLPMSYRYHLMLRIGSGRGAGKQKYELVTDTLYNFGGIEGIHVDEPLPIPLEYLFNSKDQYLAYKKAFIEAYSPSQVMSKINFVKQRMNGYAKYMLMRHIYGSMFVDINIKTGLIVEDEYKNPEDNVLLSDVTKTLKRKQISKWKIGELIKVNMPEVGIDNKKMLIAGISWRFSDTENNITIRAFPLVENLSKAWAETQLKMIDVVNRLKQEIKIKEGVNENPDTREVYLEFLKNPKKYPLQLQFLNPLLKLVGSDESKEIDKESLEECFPLLSFSPKT